MNSIRMFVFAIAFLATAFLLRVIIEDFFSEQPVDSLITAHRAAVSTDTQRVADKGSP